MQRNVWIILPPFWPPEFASQHFFRDRWRWSRDSSRRVLPVKNTAERKRQRDLWRRGESRTAPEGLACSRNHVLQILPAYRCFNTKRVSWLFCFPVKVAKVKRRFPTLRSLLWKWWQNFSKGFHPRFQCPSSSPTCSPGCVCFVWEVLGQSRCHPGTAAGLSQFCFHGVGELGPTFPHHCRG